MPEWLSVPFAVRGPGRGVAQRSEMPSQVVTQDLAKARPERPKKGLLHAVEPGSELTVRSHAVHRHDEQFRADLNPDQAEAFGRQGRGGIEARGAGSCL